MSRRLDGSGTGGMLACCGPVGGVEGTGTNRCEAQGRRGTEFGRWGCEWAWSAFGEAKRGQDTVSECAGAGPPGFGGGACAQRVRSSSRAARSARVVSMTSGTSMPAMIRSWPAHRGQRSILSANAPPFVRRGRRIDSRTWWGGSASVTVPGRWRSPNHAGNDRLAFGCRFGETALTPALHALPVRRSCFTLSSGAA